MVLPILYKLILDLKNNFPYQHSWHICKNLDQIACINTHLTYGSKILKRLISLIFSAPPFFWNWGENTPYKLPEISSRTLRHPILFDSLQICWQNTSMKLSKPTKVLHTTQKMAF